MTALSFLMLAPKMVLLFFLCNHSLLTNVQKSRRQRMTVDTSICAQTIQIIKMLDSFDQATAVSNDVSAFRAAGILSTDDEEKSVDALL